MSRRTRDEGGTQAPLGYSEVVWQGVPQLLLYSSVALLQFVLDSVVHDIL